MAESESDMFSRWHCWALTSLIAIASCTPTATTETPPTVTSAPEDSGLSDADQSSLRAGLAEAETCLSKGFLDTSCPALAQLEAHPRVVDGSAEGFLIDLVGEGTQAQIWLAAYLLYIAGDRYPRDPQLAAELLTRIEAASRDDLPHACDLGRAGGRIVASETGLDDRMEALLRNHPNACIRQSAMAVVVVHDDAERFLPTVIELATSGSAENRLFAVQALIQPGALPEADSCKLLSEVAAAHEASLEAGEVAAAHLLRCDANRDSTIALVEEWAKAGTVHYYGTGYALLSRHREDGVSEAERERLRAAAKAILDNEDNNIVSRETALKFLFEADPQRHAIAKAVGTGRKSRMWAIANDLRGYDYPHTVYARALESFGSTASQPIARQVEDGAWQRVSQLRDCYDAALEAAPDFERVVALSYEFGEDGKLVKLGPLPAELPAGFGACVDRIVRELSVTVSAPQDIRTGTLELTFELHDD